MSSLDGPLERDVQSAILTMLRLHPKVAWAYRVNTGAMVVPETEREDENGRKRRTKRRFVRFMFPGCSDIIGQMKDGRFLAIECKRPGARTEAQRFEAQAQFLTLVKASGGVAGMAYSIEQAMEIVGGA